MLEVKYLEAIKIKFKILNIFLLMNDFVTLSVTVKISRIFRYKYLKLKQ